MIDIPIIDTHLHLWDRETLSYPWLAEVPTLNRSFGLEDYGKATAGLNIEKMVFVQCEADVSQFLDEARWVAEQATIDPRIQGIVAWAPLEKGDAARDDLAELRGIPQLRGVRRIIQFEDDDAFCLRPDFVRGVQLLPQFEMSFDLCIKGDAQFANTLKLVRQCPEVPFILDHIGKPFIKEGIMEPWAGHVRDLAAMPNTVCKVSGLVSEADHAAWAADDLRPYLDTVFAAFGFDRVLFGGDWPVCTLASSYRRWIETLWDAVADCTEQERAKLFHDNAVAFYRV